jgi:hypothetical protein
MLRRLLVTHRIDLISCHVNFYADIRSDAKEHRQCNKPNQESIKKKSPMGQWYDPEQNWRLDPSSMKQSRPNEPFNWQTRQQSNPGAQGKPSSAAFGPGRPQMMHLETKGSEMRPKQQEQDVSVAQRRPKPTMPKVSKMGCEQLHACLMCKVLFV